MLASPDTFDEDEDDFDRDDHDWEDPKIVRARPRAPGPLHWASWGLFVGALFGLLEGLLSGAGFAVYSLILKKPPGCLEVTYTLVSLTVGVVLLIGSFHFHPRRKYVVAILSAIVGMVYGIINVLPTICCGLLSTATVAGSGTAENGLSLFFAAMFVLAIPATLLPLVSGIYGIVQLVKPKFKRLYLD